MLLLFYSIFILPFFKDYAHGITMMSPFTSERKQLVSFCSPSGEELRKFAEELREAIAEVNEMEHIHIQCKKRRHTLLALFCMRCNRNYLVFGVAGELERQQGIQLHDPHVNSGHTGHGSSSGAAFPRGATYVLQQSELYRQGIECDA